MALDRLTQITSSGISSTSPLTGINITGVITATSLSGQTANFSGNVNVGGVLTYEDVTNIDSIGIITARSDVLVGGGLNVTGVVTATSFVGDGSALTGIDATSLKDSGNTIRVQANTSGAVVTGVLTATSFSGDVTADTITVGDKFISSAGVGIGTTDTAGRNAGVSTAIGTLIYNTTTKGVEVYDGTGWIAGLQSFLATGGTKDTTSRSGYTVHTFTGDETFVVTGPPEGKTMEVLVIGGGGGGPTGTGSGGSGAGGLLYSSTVPFSPGTFTIQVGGGGAGAVADNSLGTVGTPSFITNPGITSITALGGGTGSRNGATGSPGGSGGGAGGASVNGSNRPQTTGDQGPSGGLTGYGNDGGSTTGSSNYAGSGGGGAGQVGGPGGNPKGGDGGDGSPYSITGIATHYAGGGGGGHEYDLTPGAGGLGGGGNGGTATVPVGSGTANKGGGAGGNGGNQTAGSGGSGIVIIAYPTA